MNQSFNRDLKYTFFKRCVHPYQTSLIDDEWIKEKNIEMEIIVPFKSLDNIEEEGVKNANDLNAWNDTGLEELLGRHLQMNDLNLK
jgi:hypothetical protein